MHAVTRAMSSQVWIKRSGQAWKLVIFYLFILSELLLIVAFVMAVNDVRLVGGVDSIQLAVAFVAVGLGSLAWLCLSVRCPRCGYKPVWKILRQAEATSWLVTVHKLDRCPSCGS